MNHLFTSAETLPNGIEVRVSITIPEALAWNDVREVAELAQMGASHTVSRVLTSRNSSETGKVPF